MQDRSQEPPEATKPPSFAHPTEFSTKRIDVKPEFIRGLATDYPQSISASLTLGLQEVRIQNATDTQYSASKKGDTISSKSVDLTGETNEKARKEFNIFRREIERDAGIEIPVGFARYQTMLDPGAKDCERIAGVFGKEIGKDEGISIPTGWVRAQTMSHGDSQYIERIAGVFGKEIGKEIRCVAG